MTLFSFKTLAFAWTGLAGVAVVGAGVLQASYVPPAPPPPAAQEAVAPPPPAPVAAPAPPSLPFQNRSLLAMLPPPEARPHPAPHVATAEKLPVPPTPPMRVAHAEPRRAPTRSEPEQAYAAAYPGWGWRRPLPYPGMYASGRAYYYGGQPGYYGWQPE